MYNEKKMGIGENKMSKKTFTQSEIKRLLNNPYVKSVSSKGITYKDDLKRYFIAEYENGKLPKQIFEECGFDIEIIGERRIRSCTSRWLAAYRKDGITGLKDTRKHNSGRPNERELSLEEKYARLEAQNNLLKAENELLKKIELAERRLMGRK
jgi:transposase